MCYETETETGREGFNLPVKTFISGSPVISSDPAVNEAYADQIICRLQGCALIEVSSREFVALTPEGRRIGREFHNNMKGVPALNTAPNMTCN